MKVLILHIAFSFLFMHTVLTAQKHDSVDIKSMVQKQIEEARKKQDAEILSVKTKSRIDIPISKASNKTPLRLIDHINWMNVKIIILVTVSITAVLLILIRRRRLRGKLLLKRKLKENIKIIREEQLIKNIDPRLKAIRKKLCLNSYYLNNVGNDVSAAARRFQIAKGEILLASKIRSYEINKNLEGHLK